MSTASSRVVFRGCDYSSAHGGVSCAYASSDASNSSSIIGSRLNNNRRKLKSAYNTGDLSPPWSRGEQAPVTAARKGWKTEKSSVG
ncbi:hypothetical protein GKD67_14095 [Parabacteroides distasonis]|uniref:Uncharacterized protein n=1 Tax=Parabacteroides distasonis TaxID=823 RepID=A0A7K0GXI6_PARDI|nr:hypothetical protein [Parabacteroides distasonis]